MVRRRMSRVGLSDHAQLWLLAGPLRGPHVLLGGALQAAEVLPQRVIVELRQKLGADGQVELANLVDELTFVHDSFTFT